MAKVTPEEVEELREQIAEMLERLAALEEHVRVPQSPFSYNIEVRKPDPVSQPLDILGMAAGLSATYSAYTEDGDGWRYSGYL